MKFRILTLFPEAIKPYLDSSIIGRAQTSGIINIEYYNIRDYSADKHKRVDDTPYGGGYGMVMTPQPLYDCFNAAKKDLFGKTLSIYMSPQGKLFNHETAAKLKEYENLILLAGHYEGVDKRVLDEFIDEEISVGDYVLSGGELPCAIVVDAVSRLIDGVLPDSECYENESIASGLLEYPQYTKPADYEGRSVPEVLRNGNHSQIKKWQRQTSLKTTLLNRPDLLKTAKLTRDDILYLEYLKKSK
jgi:tRNA (guanine37-N1)-methyltransferase